MPSEPAPCIVVDCGFGIPVDAAFSRAAIHRGTTIRRVHAGTERDAQIDHEQPQGEDLNLVRLAHCIKDPRLQMTREKPLSPV